MAGLLCLVGGDECIVALCNEEAKRNVEPFEAFREVRI
jgi:hypothetical protein